MTLHTLQGGVRILQGDVIERLRDIASESVHCVVTSPPYWNLRDYGAEGQIGLEKTPEAYVEKIVSVFREVWRVLRKDGTLWLNLGDSYAGSWGAQGRQGETGIMADRQVAAIRDRSKISAAQIAAHPHLLSGTGSLSRTPGLKNKELVGIPWRVAFALQADGWYLRQDIIWHKPNPMPESVRDRCTKAHEYLFLMAKSERYYFDSSAIAEPAVSAWNPDNAKAPDGWDTAAGGHGTVHRTGRGTGKSGNKARKPASARGVPVDTNGQTNGAVAGSIPWEGTTRNKRSVWTVTTRPFKGAHFATFPPPAYRALHSCRLSSGRHRVGPFLRGGDDRRG